MAESNNNRENVRELQQYLRTLSRLHHEIEKIAIDGIYGIETTDAVRQFQMLYNLPPSGETDFETWTAIFDRYDLFIKSTTALPIYIFPTEKYVINPEADILAVYIIQVMLDLLSVHYTNIRPVTIDGIYSDNTKGSVMDFQEVSNLKKTGEVNILTWNSLVRTYDIVK